MIKKMHIMGIIAFGVFILCLDINIIGIIENPKKMTQDVTPKNSSFFDNFESYTSTSDSAFINNWYLKPPVILVGSASNSISSDTGSKSLKLTAQAGSSSCRTNIFDHNSTILSNFTMKYNLRIDSTTLNRDSAWGLDFRIQPNGEDCYRLFLCTDYGNPKLQIKKVYTQRHYEENIQDIASMAYSFTVPTNYIINITCIGSEIKVYFNDNPTPIISATDTSYSQGYFGCYLRAGDGYGGSHTATAYFDNFIVSDLNSQTYNQTPNSPQLYTILPNPSTNGSVWIDWSDMAGASSYKLYRYSGLITEINGSVTLVNTTTISIAHNPGLANGTYYYVVVACNASGDSGISNCESITVAIPPPPQYPPNAPTLYAITPNPSTNGSIYISWSSATGASTYKLYRYSGLITEINGSVTLVNTFSVLYTTQSLTNGTYYFVVTAINGSGESEISNCVNITVAIQPPPAPKITIFQPINGTVFKSGFNIPLSFEASGASYTQYWAAMSDADEWIEINGNGTMNIAKPGTYHLRVRGYTGSVNITSDVSIFYIFIEADPKAQLLFSLSTTATAFRRGNTIEILVEIINNGTINFNRLMISFFQNSNYAIRTNMEYIYGQVIAPGENLSYTINLYIYQDTPVLQFEIDLMADNYYNHLSMQLNTQMQGGTDMTAIITYVGGGAGAAGIAVVTVKMVRGMKNKKQNKKDPNEPKPGDDREGNNSDVEFLF